MPGVGALKRFGEMLMRASENDPRLARAVEQGYDLLNPVVHGTNSLGVTEATKPFYATSHPDQALLYTRGGRRLGVGRPQDNGMMVPVVLRGQPLDTPFSYDTSLPLNDLSWLKELGVKDAEATRQKIYDRNVVRLPDDYNGLVRDKVFGTSFRNPSFPERSDEQLRLHEMLNQLMMAPEDLAPLIKFKHSYLPATISPKGRVMRAKDLVDDGDAVLVTDPSYARSPWAEFLEDGPGLMKARGGLVRYNEMKK